MDEIEIGFSRLPMGFNPENNFIYNTLKKKYRIKLSAKPEYLFYSCFQGELPDGCRVKVFFTGENRRPDMSSCDWAFSFDYDENVGDSKHMRLPLYLLSATAMERFRVELPQLLRAKQDSLDKSFLNFKKRKFCVYVAQHPGALRAEAFDVISTYKSITAPGKSKNNAPSIDGPDAFASRLNMDWQQKKIEYMRDFKFALVFENNSWPGYTTEKLVDAMEAGCVPIYWGNPQIERDFNTASFVNVTPLVNKALAKLPRMLNLLPARIYTWRKRRSQLQGLHAALEQIKRLDQNEEDMFEMYRQEWLSEGQLSKWFDFQRYEQRLFDIIES